MITCKINTYCKSIIHNNDMTNFLKYIFITLYFITFRLDTKHVIKYLMNRRKDIDRLYTASP